LPWLLHKFAQVVQQTIAGRGRILLEKNNSSARFAAAAPPRRVKTSAVSVHARLRCAKMNAMNTMSTPGTTVIALTPWSAPLGGATPERAAVRRELVVTFSVLSFPTRRASIPRW
jgi:hypothetical protein